jgi:hypothetical protein
VDRTPASKRTHETRSRPAAKLGTLGFLALGCSPGGETRLANDSDAAGSGGANNGAHDGGAGLISVDVALPSDAADSGPPPIPRPPVSPPRYNCGDRCLVDGAPDGANGLFGGRATASPGLALVYPLADSMQPGNLPDITFHWRRASAAQTVFRMHLAGSSASYDFFVPCGPVPKGLPDECIYAMPDGNWLQIGDENAGQKVVVMLSATDAAGGAVGTSLPTSIEFSPDRVAGGLYYWSTGIKGTYRLVFGQKKADPFIVPRSAANPMECSGCHTLSRDGKKIGYTQTNATDLVPGEGYLTIADSADPSKQFIRPSTPPHHDSETLALNVDGTRVVASYNQGGMAAQNAVLELRDTATGAVLGKADYESLGAAGGPYFPEFSPAASEVAVTLSQNQDGPYEWAVRTGAIGVVPVLADGFGKAEIIVAADEDFNFYPSFSPDGQWIVFVSAPVDPTGMDTRAKSYDQMNSRLRLVRRSGGTVYELGHATQGKGKTSTWPKFAPFIQSGGKVMFIAYSSKIDYGLMLKNGALGDSARPQLWMSGIDIARLDSGDPSLAPVWLPFQQIDQNNHLPYWATQISCVPGGCGTGLVCNLVSGACEFHADIH